MLSVDEAIAAILDGARALDAETVGLEAVTGRIAAEDVVARMTQPPHDASAMDGYAVRFADAKPSARLRVVGEAPAGAPFEGRLGAGEAVRIFTGGVVPDGADHVVIQEEVAREGDYVIIRDPQERPRNIRAAGVDFKQGDVLAKAGERLHEIHGALLAAANISTIAAVRRPVAAVFSNGDELIEPGGALKPGQVVNSNHYAIAAMIARWGGAPEYLGRAPDAEDRIAEFFENARGADAIVPIGGASVGDYDFVKSAFARVGGAIRFEKVSVKPGKPTWFGRLGAARVVGLPGNPASAIVTAALFVQPLLRRLAGHATIAGAETRAALTRSLPANGSREAYLRAKAFQDEGGVWRATPARNQDSALLSPFVDANVLIKRLSDAPETAAGDLVDLIWLR